MKYIEFFDAFYVDRNSGAIIGHYGKGKLRVFLMQAGLDSDHQHEIAVEDTAARWDGKSRNPDPSQWTTILNYFDERLFSDTLCKNLNTTLLKETASKFGIFVSDDDNIDKEMLSTALSKLFLEIARGGGQADFDILTAYRVAGRKDKFIAYLNKATNSFKWMGIHGGDYGLLEDYYVCNTLAFNTNSVINRKNLDNEDIFITDATLQKLLEFRKKRTQKNNYNSILIGNGGIGKTLMLQNLFLQSAAEYSSGGKVPVIVQLRDLVLKDEDFAPCIATAIKQFEPSFQNSEVEKLLEEERCQVLIDGLDEIDETDVRQFQRQLKNTLVRYPNNQIVLATRECQAIDGIKKWFSPFYLLKFDWPQTETLIGNLLKDVIDGEEIKRMVFDFISNGFIRNDSVFVTNPMLITFIVKNYDKFAIYKNDLFEFYEQAYNEMLEGHDAEKNAYKRIFHSVDDAEDFTSVFREFCAISFVDKVFSFTKSSFEEYFRRLKSVDYLSNRSKMKNNTFFHDVCATACMMYQQNSKILYIDPGFQEYLFAAYYRTEGTDNGKSIGKALMRCSLKDFDDRNAFDMLMSSSQDKTDICIFKPFLDNVFRGKSDEEAFQQFIVLGYESLHYAVLDNTKLIEYQNKNECDSYTMIESTNEPKTVVLSMLLEMIGEPETFSFTVDKDIEGCEPFCFRAIIADQVEDSREMALKVVPKEEFDKKEEFEKNRSASKYIRDSQKQIVCFGHEFDIDTYTISQEGNDFLALMTMLKNSDSSVVSSFNKLKEYYMRINKNQYKNRYK
jgi:hypothetical protein